jgi:peptide/nickel transport system permease protein
VHGRLGSLARFLARRILAAAVVVFVIASSTFLLAAAAQGDFFGVAMGWESPAAARRVREQAGMDRPVATLYGEWLARAVRLDFGTSLKYERPVAGLVAERAANTAVLAVAALALAVLAGIPAGMLTGSDRGRVAGRVAGSVAAGVVRAVSGLFLSVPPLIAAILLVAVAAFTGLAPVGGMTSVTSSAGGWVEWARDVATHVPLPAIALALPFVATLERVQSQAIRQALDEPSMTAALARGLSFRQMLWRHAWRLSAKPVAAVAGPIGGTLLSGSFAVEIVTSWPGLGRLTYDALIWRDIYLAAGCATAAAVFLAAGILASDLLLAWADPRIAMEIDEAALERLAS